MKAPEPFDPNPWLAAFAQRCRDSAEYQGHGWGASWWDGQGWSRTRSLRPIWADDSVLPETRVLVVHARSAFRNEGIALRNNMPFVAGDLAFAFNGELHGVRLKTPGETGAARLSALLDRFRDGYPADLVPALQRLDRVITQRSEYVRAMNIVAGLDGELYVHSRFGEDPDYFTLHHTSIPVAGGVAVVSSECFGAQGVVPLWSPVPNGTTHRLEGRVPC